MTRMEEYNALLAELSAEPEALTGAVDRAARRLQKRRRWRGLAVSAGSMAACFAAFVVLVNVSVPFARACSGLPVLRELVKAVAWSPSLSAAVENEYVQPLGQSQTVNGVTATVEYVIVDRKQVNLFCTLDYPKDWGRLFVDCDMGPSEGSSGTAGFPVERPGELVDIRRDYVEGDVPGNVTLTLSVCTEEANREDSPTDSIFAVAPEYQEPEYVAEFTFDLSFDPYFTAQGEVVPLDKTFTMDGQTFTLMEAEIYPTHLRISLSADPENTAWLAGMELYLENEDGERFEKSVNGISATGDPEGEGMGTFWLNSPFFSQGEHLTLHITSVRWKDKDAPRVKLDLLNVKAENLPENVAFLDAERHPDGWLVKFKARQPSEHTMGSVFSHTFWDEDGGEHDIWQFGSTYGYRDPATGETVGEEKWYTESFPLAGYTGDVAYLEPDYHRTTAETVSIHLN